MRVLHLPTAVGGGPSGLSRELQAAGVHSEVWTLDQDYLAYPVDRVIMRSTDPIIVQLARAIWAGTYVFGRWDVVHFNYGSTLYSNGGKLLSRQSPGEDSALRRAASAALERVAGVLQRIELAILRARRIPVFVTYQGDDVRQGDYSLSNFSTSIATQVPEGYYTPRTDEWKRAQVTTMAATASGIYAVNPDLMHVLPETARFIPYGHIAIDEWIPRFTQSEARQLVFAHAPSNRRVKGTEKILDALSTLKEEGYNFEIDLIEGLSNAEALERYERADIVIDQLYAGWYGGVAVEAMALGKPVVVYVREADLSFIPSEMANELPFVRATPESITDVLRTILEMPRDDLVDVAHRSRAFVERWHNPEQITRQILADYHRALAPRRKRKSVSP